MSNQVSYVFKTGWQEPGTSDEAVAAGHDVRIITWVDHTILSKPFSAKLLLFLFRYKHCKNCETALFKVWIAENVFCTKEKGRKEN